MKIIKGSEFNGSPIKLVGISSNGNYVVETWEKNPFIGEYERFVVSKPVALSYLEEDE